MYADRDEHGGMVGSIGRIQSAGTRGRWSPVSRRIIIERARDTQFTKSTDGDSRDWKRRILNFIFDTVASFDCISTTNTSVAIFSNDIISMYIQAAARLPHHPP